MKKLSFYLATISLICSCTSERVLEQARVSHKNLEYHSAADLYTKYFKTGKKNDVASIQLAECYYYMNHFREAEKQYATVMNLQQFTSANKLQYAHVLKHNGKYDVAAVWFRRYLSDNPGDLAVKNELLSCDSITSYTSKDYLYQVTPVAYNNNVSNFSPVFYNDGIVFSSERSAAQSQSEINKWTGHTYLDLYYIKLKDTTPQPLSALNSKYNDGPACFSADGKTVFFTRNMLNEKNGLVKNESSVNNFEIYTSTLINGEWSTPQLVSFDSKEYSVGHPALSSNGTRLYFVSDMPGGFGGTDIYFSQFNAATGKWGAPVNAGENVNTSENEMFPTVFKAVDNTEYLYFSSEGRPGMGGLDIYRSVVLNENGIASADSITTMMHSTANTKLFSAPQHLNSPLNSSADDFGIIFEADGNNGYLTSNRESDNVDRVFYFKKYIPHFYVEITVKEKGSDKIIPQADILITNVSHKEIYTRTADAHGKVFMEIQQNSMLDVSAKESNYFSTSGNIGNLGKVMTDTMKLVLELDPVVLNKAIRLNNIYYDYNKATIRADAAAELDGLISLLQQNPDIVIELSSHTDSRGGDSYNKKLSQKRAESAVNYIKSKGICENRIYAKGYGESQLLNKCDNKKKCGEEEHEVNRRTEFKVVRIAKTEDCKK